MGIKRLEWCLHHDCTNGFSKVNIRDFVSSASTTKNVIVVDGNQFYERYIYDRFQWMYGGVLEFVQEIRVFVKKFEEIGIKLVFFFDTNYTESSMRAIWIKRRKRNVKFSKEVIYALTNGVPPPEREFRDRLVYFKFLTINFLHKVLRCEVHCTNSNICNNPVIYAAEQNCLAILSQNSFFVFHPKMPAYLSLKALDIEEMVTIQYNIDAFREHVQLEQKFFPLLATIVGDNVLKDTVHPIETARQNIKKVVYQKMNESMKTCHFVCVSKFIRKHFEGHILENVPKFLKEQFGTDGETVTASYDDFKEKFSLEKRQPSDPNSSREMILDQVQKLYSNGEMCAEIYTVLHHKMYEHHTILENFEEFEGSAVIYRLLRQQLYGILLYEAQENSPNTITEWCVTDSATSNFLVEPATINLHPGLLSLWDTNKMSPDIQSKRWKIFVKSFSPNHNLDYNVFYNLPPNLVVLTAVLFYLQHEVPKTLLCEKILEPWEVEVFIATGILLSKNDKDICQTKISARTTNIRAVQLSALFMCGCQSVNLLVQACGLGGVIDSELFHYFDGKLFHKLCEKVKWHRGTRFLEREVGQMLDTFQQIKHIIL